MAEFDRSLLAATGRARPRVAILPTASAPDGEATFRAWAEMGVEHFGSLGAEVEPVLVRDGRFLLASFHPELTDDLRVHELFLTMVQEASSVRA